MEGMNALVNGVALGCGCLTPIVALVGLVAFIRWASTHSQKKQEAEAKRALAREVATTSRLVVRKTRRPILLDPEKITIIGSSDMVPQNNDVVYFKIGHEKVGPTHCKVYIKRNITTTDSWFIQGAGGGTIEFKEGAGPWTKVRGRRKLKDGWVLRLGGVGGPELEVKII